MRVVFAGTPDTAVPSLEAVASSRHELVAVVTRPDAPAGRGRRLAASPVAERAAELGVEVLKPVKPKDPDFLDRLKELGPDCCPVTSFRNGTGATVIVTLGDSEVGGLFTVTAPSLITAS